MTIQQIGSIGEAVGGIAVIVSLIALVLQMKQNTRAVRTESARAAEAAWSSLNVEMAMHWPTGLWLRANEVSNPDELSAEELLRLQTVLRAIWHQLTSEYYLYRDGMIPERVWTRRVRWFRGFVEGPVISYLFEEERRVLLDPEVYEQVMAASPPDDNIHPPQLF
jgi:hypothetical protein